MDSYTFHHKTHTQDPPIQTPISIAIAMMGGGVEDQQDVVRLYVSVAHPGPMQVGDSLGHL